MAEAEASDADLARRAAAGQEVAFSALMRRHKERLYRLARRHVGDADEAYDIVQESFIAAWRALARYDVSRPFYVWLAQITLNKCRDRARRMLVRRLLRGAAPIDEARDVADSTPIADDVLSDRAALIRLDRAISGLPNNLKEPLILTALDGMSQAEAAEALGISVKAVETRVYRARQRLAHVRDGKDGSV